MEKYFKFSSTATRSEFWGVVLISSVLSAILGGIAGIMIASDGVLSAVGILLFIAAIVASIWLSIAVTVRRCRDAGINPWWTAGAFIPYIGLIVWIVIGVIGTNKDVSVPVQ